MNQSPQHILPVEYAALLDTMTDAAIICDVSGEIRYMNKAAFNLFRYPKNSFEGLNISQFTNQMHQSNAKALQMPFQKILDSGEPFELSGVQLYYPDNESVAVVVRCFPLKKEDAPHLGIIITDISEIKRQVQRLKESEEQLQKTQTLGKIGSWSFDLKQNKVIISLETCHIYGLDYQHTYSIAEVQKIPLPEYRGMLDEALENLVKKGTPYNVVFKIERATDGCIIDIHSVAEYNPGSHTVHGVIQDITERTNAEKRLVESEKKMRSIFRVAPTGIGVVSNRVLVDVNPRLCEMTGYTSEELVGKSALILYPTQEEFEYVGSEKYRQINLTGTGTVETRWVKKDGTVIHVLLASTPIDANDLALGVTFTALDISQIKAYQQSLLESESKYRLLVENQTDLVVKIDPQGQFLFVSPSYCKMFDKREEDLLGKAFMPLVHEDDRTATEEAMKSLWKPPYSAYIEQRAMTRDGWCWLAWVDTAITDSEGNVLEIIGVGRNITPQKEAEVALQQAFDNWQRTFDAMRDGVALLDSEHNILQSNIAFQTLVQHTNDQLHGKKCYAFVHGAECPIPECPHVRMLKSRQRETMELEIQNKVFEVVVDPIIDRDGTITGSVHIMAEITQRKEAESSVKNYAKRLEQAEQNALMGSWEYNVKTREVWFSKQLFRLLRFSSAHDKPSFSDIIKNIHPDDQLKVLEQMTLIRNGIVPEPIEFRNIAHDGTERHLLPGFIAEKNKADEIVRISGTILDITERKHIENSLRESEERWHFALEGSGDGIWDWNIATNEIYFSDQWKRMIGLEPGEMENKFSEWEKRVHPDDLQPALDDIRRHKEGETPLYLNEHRLMHKDGSYRWILDRGKIISHDEEGNPLRFIGTHSDITKRKNDEQELKKLKDNLQSTVDEQTHLLKERLIELERFHEATIEREFRIKELRDEVERLNAMRNGK
jgi:PAS domain S-box-containing protein